MKARELMNLKFETDDELHREPYAEHLTTFLYDNEDINVLSVNSSWGTGKTWFVNMWINFIKDSDELKNKIIPVYYNAWENDDFENAFVPLLAEIDSQLFEKYSNPELNHLKDAAGAVIKSGIFNFAKTVTGGLADFEAGEKALHKKELYESYVSDYQKNKEARESFINSLEKYPTEFEEPKKIFVFIDELDRCRPTFAIETLERIKHYFEVSGFQFILMLDSTQLSHSVKVLYGNDCDTSGYLRRFVDVEYSLGQPSITEYLNNVIETIGISKYLSEIGEFFELTLRDCDKLAIWFKAFLAYSKRLDWDVSEDLFYYYSYIILLRYKLPETFQDLHVSNEITDSHTVLPFHTEIDRYTSQRSGVRICKMMHIMFRKHYYNESNISGLIGREKEWIESKQIKDLIIKSWNIVKELNRFDA